jgi:Fe2+ transport system protein FeoA
VDNANPIIPLAQLTTGEDAHLVNLSKGLAFIGRLTSLGFTPGVHIHMIQNIGHGPLLVSIRGTRVALGRNEARSILVERCPE